MKTLIRVGLVGVTGYTGVELLRLLAGHPRMTLTRATSRTEAGKKILDVHPAFLGTGVGELVVSEPDPEDLAGACDLVFLAVPHVTAMEIGAALVDAGLKVVDLSADFRLRDPAVYEEWYKHPHTRTAHLAEAVYGLPELYAKAVKKARLVANPGCYPTAAVLGLMPALKNRFISLQDIVIDAKSGTSGAGRGAKTANLYCEVTDSFKAYGLGKHRHTPEIEQEVSALAKKPVRLSFNPHLVPMSRGILETIYTTLKKDVSLEEIHAAYTAAYENQPWTRVLPLGRLPETRFVRGTLFCDIGLVKDPRTNRLIIVSAIDNLCRGASGQAMVNANLMTGLAPDAGIPAAPMSL